MKNKFAVVAAFVALSSVAANAADLPVRTYKKAPVPVATGWTGFYAGANVGYGFEDPTVTFTPTDLFSSFIAHNVAANFAPITPPTAFNTAGAAGGFQVGYNKQFGQLWLLGVETDFNFSDIKGQARGPFDGLPGGGFGPQAFTAPASEQVKWFGTLRARAGILATPSLLLFGTGGLAYGQVKHYAAIANDVGNVIVSGGTTLSCIGGVPCYVGTSSRTAVGWTAGGGIEYAVGGNWTVKGEYLYVNLGADSFGASPTTFTGPAPLPFAVSFTDTHFNLVRVGGNYRF